MSHEVRSREDLEGELLRLRQEVAELRAVLDGPVQPAPRDPSEAMFRAVLDQLPVALFVVSLPDVVVGHINQAAVQALGIADEPTLLNQPLAQIRHYQSWQDLPAEDSATAPDQLPLARALRGETSSDVEFSILRKDGAQAWFLGGGAPIFAEDGRAIAGLLFFRDVTERRKDTERLRQMASEQRTILDTVTAGICLLKDRRIQWVNPAFETILGYPAEEVLGEDTWRFYSTAIDFERVEREGHQRLTPDSAYTTEVLLKRKSGERFWCNISGRAMASSPLAKASIWVLQDISERRRTEDALRLSEARLDAAQAQAHIGSWEYDANTHESVWSKEMARLVGMAPGSTPPVALANLELVHPEDRALVLEVYHRAVDTGEPGCCEYRSNPSQGPERFFSMTCDVLRDTNGKSLQIAGTLQDITERKAAEGERARLQTQLHQAMKMEAVGRLAGGVAHDFNNLLTVISGNVELAKLDLDPADPLTQSLDQVANAASSAAELTHQLLAFSRRQIIEPKVVNLNELVNTVRKMLDRLIGEDVELVTRLASDLGSVEVDPGQFDQVVVNLAVNARDAMPDGGCLHIETTNVDLDQAWCKRHAELTPGRFVMLAVSDTGHGMTEATRTRIFEPFFTTKPKGRGTGLGLAVIFGIVKQAGGAIDVYSEVGRGTTFKVYLPRIEGPAEKLERMRTISDLPRGIETVLLVEDESSVRELSVAILKRQGYQVLAAANGGEALLCAEKHSEPIHLLFTDVVLPGINGRELAERIRKLHSEIAILFSSGYTEDAIFRHGVMDDQFDFISKPYTLQTVARKVRQVLDARRSPPRRNP